MIQRYRNAFSLKLRLSILITLSLAAILIVGATQLVSNAREDVRAEIASTVALVTRLLDGQLDHLSAYPESTEIGQIVRISKLRDIRHLKIEYLDERGRLVDSNFSALPDTGRSAPPAWFAALVARADLHEGTVRRPVVHNGVGRGEIVVTPDPSFEIAEIWDDTIGLLVLVALFFVVVNAVVYAAVASALRPVDRIWIALNELERGNLDARLPHFDLPELARISDKFNHMAQTLQQSTTRNHRLAQQLIHIQEEERRTLARDLHDELGQSLTAIKMDGGALLEMSKSSFPAARESAQAIVDITHHVMQQIRAMLQRLRPEVLDGLGLQAALSEMAHAWQQRNRDVRLAFQCADGVDSDDDTANITAYRVIQECLTNTARHADAKAVDITVQRFVCAARGDLLEIVFHDNGNGFDDRCANGFGLSGMRERVEGIGGAFEVFSALREGTRIRAMIPLGSRA